MRSKTTETTRSIEVFRSDENAKHLYIHVYTKLPPNDGLTSLIRLNKRYHDEEEQLIRSIARLGLPEGGEVIKTEWGKITTDDGVNIFVIRLTADKEFITNQRGIALRLNSLVWHPTNRWLMDVCRNAIDG